IESIEAELSDKKSEITSLGEEIDALKTKWADAEAAAADSSKKSDELEAKLAADLGTLKKSLSGKDDEINLLLARVKEMAPLGLQLKDRELKLREWDAKHTQALKVRDNEIAELKLRISDLDLASQRAADEAEAKLKTLESQLNAKHQEILETKDAELVQFQTQAALFESAKSRIAELESKLQAFESEQAGLLRDKDSAILHLELRVKELEPLSIQLAERDARI